MKNCSIGIILLFLDKIDIKLKIAILFKFFINSVNRTIIKILINIIIDISSFTSFQFNKISKINNSIDRTVIALANRR